MRASPHPLILRGLLAAGFLAACSVISTAQEPKSPPTAEEQQKQFAEIVEKMKKAETGQLYSYFRELDTPAARPFARDVLPFVRLKSEEYEWVGQQAAFCLGEMGAREVADDLAGALPEVTSLTRFGIMTALEQFGDKRSIDAAKMLLSTDGFINFNNLNSKGGRQHWGTTPPMQDDAIRVLIRHRTPALEEEITKMLTSPEPHARLGAIRCLREMDATSRAGDVAKLLGPDQPPGIRSYAILTLGDFRAAAFAPDIAAVLEQKRPDIQDGWPELEITTGSFSHVRNPLPMLQRPEFPVSIAACKALAAMNARQYIPQIAAALQTVPDQWDMLVLRALADMKAREAGPQIAALLEHGVGGITPNPISVVETLRIIGAVEQAPQLARLLLPPDKGGPVYRRDDEESTEIIDALEVLSPALLRESIPVVLRTPHLPRTKSRVLALLQNTDATPFTEDVRKLTLPAEPAELRMEAGCLLRGLQLMSDTDALAGVARCLAQGWTRENLVDKRKHSWLLEVPPLLVFPLLSHAEDDVVRGALQFLTFISSGAPPDALTALLSPSRSQEVKEAALDAMAGPAIALNDGQLNAVAALAASDPALAARAGEVLLRHHTGSQTPLLFAMLSHDDDRVRSAAWRALQQPGGTPPVPELFMLLERSLRRPDQNGFALFATYSLLERDAALRPAIPFLSLRDPDFPKDPAAAREILTALSAFCDRADAVKHNRTLQEAAIAMARIVGAAAWDYSDAPFLRSVAGRLTAKDTLDKNAVSAGAIRAVAKDMAAQHPLRRIARAVLWIIAAQAALWLLVLTLYPWSRLARWMVWNRWTRRGLGFGWIGSLVLRARWLRERLWRPFGEALVPPGEVVSFDEWTFFDSVRVTPAAGGEAQPALRVLKAARGVTVLHGESGLGKTTLLQALAGSSERPVAILQAAECGGGLLAALRARLPRHARGDARFLRALVQRGTPDIFVDAVHEALPEVRAKLTEEVQALRGANIVLTTQPAEWAAPQGVAEWRLEPLRAQDIAPFLLKQGSAAVEAAGPNAGPPAERQRKFAARTAAFLQHLDSLPAESAEAVALRRMLGNPMEAVLAAELLAAGETPDPNRLLEQRMEHLEDDYVRESGGEFPAAAFAEHLRTWRASGAPLLRAGEVFAGVAAFLARHRLLRKSAEGVEAWRFRHDKVMEWFLRPA